MSTTIEFCIFKLLVNLGTKFQFELTILMFWTKVAKKACFSSKTQKVKTTIEFYIFELVMVPKFSWNWQFWLFFVQICPKWCFPCTTGKVRKLLISLRTKFQLKLTIVIFLARFAQKGCFPSKARKVKITNEFYIFELV